MKNKTLDERWEEVKEFYETHYRIRFKKRLDEQKVLELWKKMHQVCRELQHWYETPKPLPKNFTR